MVLAAATGGPAEQQQQHSHKELLLHPPNPLDHLKKVFHGFCDPRSTISPEGDDADDHGGDSPPPLNRSESRSVEQKVALERSVDAIPVPPAAVTNDNVVVVTSTEDDDMEVVLQPNHTKYEEVLVLLPADPSTSVASSTDSVESEEKEPPPSSKSRQIIPAHRYPYLMETTFFTLSLLVFTLFALGRLGVKLDIEFSSKITGDPNPSLIVINDSQGEQLIQPNPVQVVELPEETVDVDVDVDRVLPVEEVEVEVTMEGIIDELHEAEPAFEAPPLADDTDSHTQPPVVVEL